MFHLVPLLPHGNVLDAKISCDIDQPHTGVIQSTRLIHRDPVRSCEKDEITTGQRVARKLRKPECDTSAQIWEHVGHRHADLFARGNDSELASRVQREQPQELDPGVTGAAYDANLDCVLGHTVSISEWAIQCYRPCHT